jgi:SpoVK/Ycf46/Vps4 family AAA+-type ATPase
VSIKHSNFWGEIEITLFSPVRSSRQDQIHSSIVSTLLALLDGLDNRGQVVVIGATNRLDSLDPALRRPGRFDRELRFDLPDQTAREAILNIHTSGWKEMKPDAQLLSSLAERTSGYCGADLKALCTESVLVAVRMRFPHIYVSNEKLELDTDALQVQRQHFDEALRRIVPASRRGLYLLESL